MKKTFEERHLKTVVENQETLNQIIKNFEEGKNIKHENNFQIVSDSLEEMETIKEEIPFLKENGAKEEKLQESERLIETYLPKLQKVWKRRNSFLITLLMLRGGFEGLVHSTNLNDSYFKALELVQMINDFYDIGEEEKAPNKIAFGWKFTIEKTNPQKYFSSVLRNYLKRNNKFNHEEWMVIIGLSNHLI